MGVVNVNQQASLGGLGMLHLVVLPARQSQLLDSFNGSQQYALVISTNHPFFMVEQLNNNIIFDTTTNRESSHFWSMFHGNAKHINDKHPDGLFVLLLPFISFHKNHRFMTVSCAFITVFSFFFQFLAPMFASIFQNNSAGPLAAVSWLKSWQVESTPLPS